MDAASGNPGMTHHIAFIVEQALGHATYALNLQRHVARAPDVEACWAPIAWETSGVTRRLPIYRSNWTVRAGIRARRALSSIAARARLDALFFHTHVPAVLSMKWIRRVPSIVSLDATPRQYDAFGEHYGHRVGPAWVEHLKWRMYRE